MAKNETLQQMEDRLRAANAEWYARKAEAKAKKSMAEHMYPHLRSTVAERDAKKGGK
jgi:type II secretory pathway component PulK